MSITAERGSLTLDFPQTLGRSRRRDAARITGRRVEPAPDPSMSLALDGLTNGARQGRIPDIDRRRIGQGSLRNAGEKAADPSSRGGAPL